MSKPASFKKLILASIFTIGNLTLIISFLNNSFNHNDKLITSLDYISLVEHTRRLNESRLKLLEEFQRNQSAKIDGPKSFYPELRMRQFFLSDQGGNYLVPDNISSSLESLERLVHIDLKGAPPVIGYFDEFIPFIKKHGATGVILEYEDMFPFEGILKDVRHGNAYTKEDVWHLSDLASKNGLTVMPLGDILSHMLESVLKCQTYVILKLSSNLWSFGMVT